MNKIKCIEFVAETGTKPKRTISGTQNIFKILEAKTLP